MSPSAPIVGSMMPRQDSFGQAPDGSPVDLYTFSNARGIEIRIMTYGGIIVSLHAPDRDGRPGDIVLGHDDLDGYVRSSTYFGALIGGRIARVIASHARSSAILDPAYPRRRSRYVARARHRQPHLFDGAHASSRDRPKNTT